MPGWWEDMIPRLQMAQFWSNVQFNPEFRPLRYPMTGTVPDMVLQTIVGCFWYRRVMYVEDGLQNKKIIFHCGGVQNRALLWINGAYVGEHCGYSTPFSMDVTEYIRFGEENTVLLAVSNHQAYNETGAPISGCTSRAANRYTGGITGKIWLDVHSADAVADVYVSSYCEENDSFHIHTEIEGTGKHRIHWRIKDGSETVSAGIAEEEVFSVSRANMVLWSPKTPKLYTLSLSLESDGIVTDEYEQNFGIRVLRAEGNKLCFNGQPIYLRGICEHGYFARTVHPDPDIRYYLDAIRILKRLDFNYIRFHTWIPTEEYMTAADRLGILLHVESPNNTTETEWAEIMRFVRRHPSVVIGCCGNELLIDDPFLEHLERCAEITHTLAPNILFSPMNALRGVEYHWTETNIENDIEMVPFKHNPRRMKRLQNCSDLFSSYALGQLSYDSVKGNPETVDSWADVYKLPRITHEICIHGTYVDLGLEWRYEGSRIGESEVYSSVRKILQESGLIHRAPLYYKNSCQWQRLLRKHCFENTRLCGTLSGYDYLGDIDHHWHTFGYRAGMMNEFYEMKPTETEDNIRRYNGESVILCDLGTKRCFSVNDTIRIEFLLSLFGGEDISDGTLHLRVENLKRDVIYRTNLSFCASNGILNSIAQLAIPAPSVDKPSGFRVCARFSEGKYELNNEWDIWVFPKIPEEQGDILCVDTLDEDTLEKLTHGADVLLSGTSPFYNNPLSFRMSLAGRTAGNLATVIEYHPLTEMFEHEGFCGWQFSDLMDNASCLYYPPETEVPFEPIIEVVSSYKWIRRQAAVAEFQVGQGRLLVSTFNTRTASPASSWWKANLLRYMQSAAFEPRVHVEAAQLRTLFANGNCPAAAENDNRARNTNDKTMR